jgi:hypothetical protein
MITQHRLMELVNYNVVTGFFTWKVDKSNVKAGSNAGTKNRGGYLVFQIDKKLYYAHRLAWLYFYGEYPRLNIDHINGIRHDNRIKNLRDVTKIVNSQNIKHAKSSNNKTGLLGVYLCKGTGRYKAEIRVNKIKKHLGMFADPESAHQAYINAKREFHEGCTI